MFQLFSSLVLSVAPGLMPPAVQTQVQPALTAAQVLPGPQPIGSDAVAAVPDEMATPLTIKIIIKF